MRLSRTRALVLCLAAVAPQGAIAEDAATPPKEAAPAAHADGPIRPPPFKDEPAAPSHPKVRHLSLSLSAVTLSMPGDHTIPSGSAGARAPSNVEYVPTVGLEAELRFPIFRYLQAGVAATFGMPSVAYDAGALGIAGAYDGDAMARVQGEFRAFPTLPIDRWVSVFAILGVGFGRLEFPEVTVDGPDHTTRIGARGASFFDFPLGVGATFTLVPRWLTLGLSVDVAPMVTRDGDAFVPVQVLEGGSIRRAHALPNVDATYRQALTLSLIL